MKKTLFTLATVAALGVAANTHAMGETPAATANNVVTASTQTQAEITHRMETLQTGMLALETSKIALSKATSPVVKQFAQLEVDEQTTIAGIFKSMYPNAPEVALSAENIQKLESLKAASASNFDMMYVKAQIDGHKKLLSIQDDYLDSAKNREEMNVTKLARGQIKEHIMLLQAYQANLK